MHDTKAIHVLNEQKQRQIDREEGELTPFPTLIERKPNCRRTRRRVSAIQKTNRCLLVGVYMRPNPILFAVRVVRIVLHGMLVL